MDEVSLAAPSGDQVALARERFLSRDAVPKPGVRQFILASWERSFESRIDADSLDVPYSDDWDSATPLLHSAVPVLEKLHEQLQDEPVSIILTEPSGLVLERRTTSRGLMAQLDAVSLAPGFSYAEEFAGTNGIGTAITSGQRALVDGREHYTSPLGQFACAGVPIHHPTRRSVVGILDLTTWAQSSGAMLMALASATAEQIGNELLAHTDKREYFLFQEYLRTSQQCGGPVLAINADVVMMNEDVRATFDAAEQQALLGYAVDMVRAQGTAVSRTVELPSGRLAQLRCTPVGNGAGTVFRVRPLHAARPIATGAGLIRGGRAPLSLPALVGASPVWTRCVQQVNSCYQAGEWMALAGEAGTGKQTILRAVHRFHDPAGGIRVLDRPLPGAIDEWLSTLAEEAARPGALVVLRHVDRYAPDAAEQAAEQLLELAAQDEAHARIAVTATSHELPTDGFAIAFPRTIEVPPLRHHIDDLGDLVTHLVRQAVGDDRLTVSSQTMAQLRRLDWPGNVTQLRRLLSEVVKRRHSGVIEIDDLPPSALASGHQVLTALEAMERDAIVQALLDNDEHPAAAALALGMSRATIYRKFRRYGIKLPLPR